MSAMRSTRNLAEEFGPYTLEPLHAIPSKICLVNRYLRRHRNKGARMHRMVIGTACSVVLLFVGITQAEAQFSIRAASAQPVEGWQRMQVENSERVIWVAPTAALIASDIE